MDSLQPPPQIQINNTHAAALKSLHQPGTPLILTNIYDIPSTTTLLSLNQQSSPPLVKAAATTSYAIASALSIPDADLSLSQNLTAISHLSPLVRAAGIPLSVDLQDGYGDDIVHAVKSIVSLGVVGANIEDSYPERGFSDGMTCLRSVEEAAERVRAAIQTAREAGVPDFVVNARTDVLRLTPNPEGWTREMMLDETVKRGKAYLEAGATCVFVWGGSAGPVTTDEVMLLTREFQGRLAVKLADGKDGLSVKELSDIGICRISVGAGLMSDSSEKLLRKAERILKGGQFWSADEDA